MASAEPLRELERWLERARASGSPAPASVAFVTVGADGRPSARTVSLKRIERDALIFTSALWTRKAREMSANPHVALLFHWPAIGRQIHVVGEASAAEDELADELFCERDLANRLQTIVSRQGEPVADLEPLRARAAHLRCSMEAPPARPQEWGAIRVRPEAIELWSEAADRMHDRRLYSRDGSSWTLTRLAP